MASEKALSVAIQGERGAFSHQAAVEALGAGVEVLPRATFDELFDSVVEGKADRALVPIENSLHGSIHENYDRLKSRPLHIVGETQLRIRQCLIARPGLVDRHDPPRGVAPGGARAVPALLRRAAAGRGRLGLRHRGRRPGPDEGRARHAGCDRLAPGGRALRGACAPRRHRGRPGELHALPAARARGGELRGGEQDVDRVRARQPARGALPRARRVRLARPGPVQARVAAAARAPVGALLLPGRARRPATAAWARRSTSWAAAAASCGSSGRTRKA